MHGNRERDKRHTTCKHPNQQTRSELRSQRPNPTQVSSNTFRKRWLPRCRFPQPGKPRGWRCRLCAGRRRSLRCPAPRPSDPRPATAGRVSGPMTGRNGRAHRRMGRHNCPAACNGARLRPRSQPDCHYTITKSRLQDGTGEGGGAKQSMDHPERSRALRLNDLVLVPAAKGRSDTALLRISP